jgi:hypothetical protein
MGFDERGNPLAEHWADECPADDAVDLVVAGRQRVANVVEESGQLELTVLGMRATQVRRTLQPVMQEGEAADVFVGLFDRARAAQEPDDGVDAGGRS